MILAWASPFNPINRVRKAPIGYICNILRLHALDGGSVLKFSYIDVSHYTAAAAVRLRFNFFVSAIFTFHDIIIQSVTTL